MTWVLDTCVLLDLACNDKIFAGCASRAIQSKLDETLTIAPITYVELAPQFLGDVERQNEFLRDLWIDAMAGGRGTRKAFATPWEVCFNVAYPPSGWCFVHCALCFVREGEGQRTRRARSLSFRF